MATQTFILGRAGDGSVEVSYDFDDVTHLITTVRLINNGTFGNITVTLTDRNTGVVVYGPTTRGFGTGTFTQDVSSAGLHLVQITGKRGTSWTAPFNFSMEWVNALATKLIQTV